MTQLFKIPTPFGRALAISAVFLTTLVVVPTTGCQEQAPAADGKAAKNEKDKPKPDATTAGPTADKPTAGTGAPDAAGTDEAPIEIDAKVALAAKVASAIAAEPEKADDILAKNELDRDKLDDLMFEIASDTEMTRQYKLARATTTG